MLKQWLYFKNYELCVRKKIMLLKIKYSRPIGDQLKTNMSDPRPIGVQMYAWLKTDMPHRKPSCIIEDPSDIHQRPMFKHVSLIMSHVGLQCGMSVSYTHVGLWYACRSPIRMLVSNETCWSPMRHVGLQWSISISDVACWFPKGLPWMDRTGLNRTGLDWPGKDYTGLDRTELDRTGQDRTRMDQTGPDGTGRDQTGLDWTILDYQTWLRLRLD